MKESFAMRWLRQVGAAALLVILVASAKATFINNSFGLTSPIQIDEHIQSTNQSVTDQNSDLGVTFSGAFYDLDINTRVHVVGHRIGNFISFLPVSGFPMRCNSPQNCVAFAMAPWAVMSDNQPAMSRLTCAQRRVS